MPRSFDFCRVLLPLCLRLLSLLCLRLIVYFCLRELVLSPVIDVLVGLNLFLMSCDSLSRWRTGLVLRGFLAFYCRVWLIFGADLEVF